MIRIPGKRAGSRDTTPRAPGPDAPARGGSGRRPGPVVVHVGVAGPVPGGMAQVLNEYLSWPFPSLQVRVLASTRGRGDPWAPLRSAVCALRMLGCRLSPRPHAFVVHMSNGGSFVREGGLVALARVCGFPVAVQLHGSVFVPFAARWPRLVRAVLRTADVVYVLTDRTGDVVRDLLAGPRPVVVKVANGVRVPEGPPTAPKEPIVLLAGQIGARKGADVLLGAWARVVAGHPGWRLVLAGPADRDAGVTSAPPPGVTLLGAVSRDEVLSWQVRAAVAALPSRDEALPLFLLEAMARRCAVVATPVGDVGRLLSGGCGVVVPVGDEEALAAALDRLMTDPVEAARSGEAGHARVVERYSAAALLPVFEREWQALLAVDRRG